MFKGDNLIGVALVLLCLIAAGIMIWATVTDRQLTYNGPGWLVWILAVVMLGGSIWGLMQGYRNHRRGGNGEQWPSPSAGQKSLLDRLRGKDR